MSQNDSHPVTNLPLTGAEPVWVRDLPQDNIIGAVIMASVEIAILKDQINLLESAVKALGGKITSRNSSVNIEERAHFDEAVTGPIVQRIVGELFRSQEAWTSLDPRVSRYFDQPSTK